MTRREELQEAYEDALKRLPKNDSSVQTPDGPGNVSDVNVLKETRRFPRRYAGRV